MRMFAELGIDPEMQEEMAKELAEEIMDRVNDNSPPNGSTGDKKGSTPRDTNKNSMLGRRKVSSGLKGSLLAQSNDMLTEPQLK